MSMKRQKSPLVASTEYNEATKKYPFCPHCEAPTEEECVCGNREQPMSKPTIHEIGVGDVAYGIALQAIEGKWDAAKLGPCIVSFAKDYANEEHPMSKENYSPIHHLDARLEELREVRDHLDARLEKLRKVREARFLESVRDALKTDNISTALRLVEGRIDTLRQALAVEQEK